jgi:hypothetical protein
MKSSKGEELTVKLTEQKNSSFMQDQNLTAYVRNPRDLPLPESDKSVTLDTMRPVSHEVRNLLYESIRHCSTFQKDGKRNPRIDITFEKLFFGYG